jgi:hypothetical protein
LTNGISDHVRRIIAEHFDSIEKLEVLLLLRRTPDKWWNADEVAAELRTSMPSVAERLETLRASRFLEEDDSSARMYRYGPDREELDASVGALEEAYRERRVMVIGLVFSDRTAPVRQFADAFRLEKGKKDG